MSILRTAAAALLLPGLMGAAYQRNPAAPRTGVRVSPADEAAAAAARMTPEQVVAKLHAINRMEIEAARTALRKSKDSEVIRYARLLARDHKLADSRLYSLAKREGVPVGVSGPDADDRAAMKSLDESAPGPDFDRAYVDAMKAGHDKALALLTAARAGSTNWRLRGYIDEIRPVIEQHDRLAGKLQAKRLG